MTGDLLSLELSQDQFEQISETLYRLSGISLGSGKEALVRARLARRLRILGLSDFQDYVCLLENDQSGDELAAMVDSLTTNKTSFFREPQHFDYLRLSVIPRLREIGGRIRIWSAGCSSGQEAFSIAMTLRDEIPEVDRLDIRILATDISNDMLNRARGGVYSQESVREAPLSMLQAYFTRSSDGGELKFRANPDVRAMVQFARLNLMSEWPMNGPFDVIFCRNVMIYFDKATQDTLVRRFSEILKPGGHLFVGHAESLIASSDRLRYVRPAVYVK